MTSFDDESLMSLLETLDLSEPDDVEDFTKLGDFDLITTFNELTHELVHLAQIMHQNTDEAREKHSRRGAIVVEMKARLLL